jgi:hypothetical protein
MFSVSAHSTVNNTLMEPPPESTYPDREALVSSVRQFALDHGYVLTIRRSTANKNVVLGCDLGRKYHDRIYAPDGSKRRKTSTRQIGCPFQLYGARRSDGTWDLKVRNPQHTHEANDLIAHPHARKFPAETRAEIARLSRLNVKPQAIEAILRDENPSALFTRRDIYNIRMAERIKQLEGRTPVEHLIDRLQKEGNWEHRLQCDSSGHITLLMFAHKRSIEYANKYNRVFLLDCTYKTNRYRMPLLHIVGVAPTNASFSIAFCFMQNEQTESYLWALRSFLSLLKLPIEPPVLCTDRDLALISAIGDEVPQFPHLLCVWHIHKNVQAHCKKEFTTNEEYNDFFGHWIKICSAHTEKLYEQAKSQMEAFLADKQHVFRYLNETWLVHREKFVVAWSQEWLHLGNSATSRVEGAHAAVKHWITNSTADILSVFELVEKSVEGQLNAITAALARDRIFIPVFPSKTLFANLIRRVSRHAIILLVQQHDKVKRATQTAPLVQCTNVFSRTMGLPCSHRISDILESKSAIELEEIHPFWRIEETPLPYRY